MHDAKQPPIKHSGPSDSDLEEDDYIVDERPSAEITREDQEVLDDDYESDLNDGQQVQRTGAHRFLGRWFNRGQDYVKPINMRRRRTQPSRRHRERRQKGKSEEEAEMMYNMEEGGEASMSASQASSDIDIAEWKEMSMEKKKKRFGSTPCQRFILHAVIILFFIAMAYGAYMATIASKREKRIVELKSNGTSLWAPTTLIISLDGFRADFLERGLTPTLNAFIREGVSPLYMLPPFPSVTFVSHYSMATGMYPEEHGIVGNTFWDPELQEEFYYTHTESSMQPKWWGGEPFWVTAEKHGVKTAIHMWPGSEAHIAGIDLEFVDKFKEDEKLSNKVKRIFGWLDLPGPESLEKIDESRRPQLIVAYVPNVDSDGHLYGPNSTEIRQTIKDADDMLTSIFDGIRARNLTDIVNVIVVSDHGMATTSVDRLIQLDDVVDVSKIAHNDGWPLFGLRPKNDEDIEPLYHQIKAKAEENPNFKVYLRDKDMPPEYHFSKNPRIAPLWIVPETGWAIVQKDEFDLVAAKNEGLIYHPRGLHGYDYRHPLMRAIFVARGPAFPHQPHSRVEAFQNIEVYNILCDTLGIEPSPNSGTLRLPFKTVGLHSDKGAPKLDVPDDLPPQGTGSTSTINVVPTSTSSPSPSPTNTTPTKEDKKKPSTITKVWQWFGETFDDIKDTIKGWFGNSR